MNIQFAEWLHHPHLWSHRSSGPVLARIDSHLSGPTRPSNNRSHSAWNTGKIRRLPAIQKLFLSNPQCAWWSGIFPNERYRLSTRSKYNARVRKLLLVFKTPLNDDIDYYNFFYLNCLAENEPRVDQMFQKICRIIRLSLNRIISQATFSRRCRWLVR